MIGGVCMICPVCKKETNTLLCSHCGFDGSRDYEHHPSVCPLPADAVPISRLQNQWQAKTQDCLTCDSCGNHQFVLLRREAACACTRCGKKQSTADVLKLQTQHLPKENSPQPVPKTADTNAPLYAISAGLKSTLLLHRDGTVAAIGSNEDGQCMVAGWRNIISVAAGTFHSVGLRRDGTVVSTGDNRHGQSYVDHWRDIVSVCAAPLNTVGLCRNAPCWWPAPANTARI